MKLIEEKGSEVIKAEMIEQKQNSRLKLKKERDPEVLKEQTRQYNKKNRDKSITEKGHEVMNIEQKNQKLRSRNKLRVELGPKHLRMQQNHWKEASRKRKLADDEESTRNKENFRKKLSRNTQRERDPENVKENQRKWQQKSRLIDSLKKRLKKFKERTMLNAIFTCSCCHRNLFDCNVCKLDNKLKTEIESKKPGLYNRAITSELHIKINETNSSYICFACKKHLKGGKLPPMAATSSVKRSNLTHVPCTPSQCPVPMSRPMSP